jgi:CRP/FNR family cyclic AMP-dependent transcriptional regulator
MTVLDALKYLPRRAVQSYARGQSIFDSERPSQHLYVVIVGRVQITDEGCKTIADIVSAGGFFGESCLVDSSEHTQVAVAKAGVSLMAWTPDEIEQEIERDPRLGLALLQYLGRKCIVLQNRIDSMAGCKAPERLMLALVHLASDEDTEMMADGAVRLRSLTHQTIAGYIGTSREMVTLEMNRLRRLGMLKYNRKHFDVRLDEVRDELRRQGVTVPAWRDEMQRSANNG